MRIARIDYYTPDDAAMPFERGPELPRHEVSLEAEIAYFKRFEPVEAVEILPAKFPVLGRAKITMRNQPPVVLVMRDCGTY